MSVSQACNKLYNDLDSEFIVRQRVYNTEAATAEVGKVATLDFNIEKSGYAAFTLQTYFVGNRYMHPYNVFIGRLQLQNNTSTSQSVSKGAAYQDIIYIKESYFTNLGG